jgi:hypothetical protein
MKKLVLCAALFAFGAHAQNNVWVVPPNLIIDPGIGSQQQPLPINPDPAQNDLGVPFDYYDGKVAHCSANGLADPAGNLMFFVVDGLVYNNQGAYIDYVLPGTLDVNYTDDSYEVVSEIGHEFVIFT